MLKFIKSMVTIYVKVKIIGVISPIRHINQIYIHKEINTVTKQFKYLHLKRINY